MLGTLAAPSLLGSCTGSEGDKAAGISFAMNYFKVSEGAVSYTHLTLPTTCDV